MTYLYLPISLILGLLAWGLAAAALQGKLRLLAGSYAACAVSILVQLCEAAERVRLEDWSFLMDTIHASVLGSEIMLGVTVLLSIIAIVRAKRESVS